MIKMKEGERRLTAYYSGCCDIMKLISMLLCVPWQPDLRYLSCDSSGKELLSESLHLALNSVSFRDKSQFL